MANKSRMATILGLEEDEEYTVKDGNNIVYRIHKGERQYKDALGRWHSECSENTLTALINDPSLIIRKPRFTDEEMTLLRLLRKYGKVNGMHKGNDGLAGVDSRGPFGLSFTIADCLLKPGEALDLDELFKEEADG